MTTEQSGRPPTEEELRAALEEEMKQLRVEDLLLHDVVNMISLGVRRTGLAPQYQGERDPAQVRLAIESVRALLPLVEQVAPAQAAKAIRDELSRLQLDYVRIGGGAERGEQARPSAAAGTPSGAPPAAGSGSGQGEPDPQQPRPGEPGPAQRSGRLWVPGQ